FIIKQFHNTIWVPNRLTQQRMLLVVVPLSQRQIFQLKTPDEQSHSFQLQSTPRNLPASASRDCVSLSGPASAQLALRQPLEPLRHPHWLSLALRNSWLPLRES